ncbi:MAG: hypothetical protein C0592_14315 [Marinilabiliales bacterium]|nr:MAG: hypothetical protein C0592_14315 [Marinilabiliales bacterium]
MWTSLSLEKSFLDKKLDIGINQEFRFNNNSTSLNNYFTEVEADYEILKDLKVGAGYKFIRNNRNSGYRNEYRYNLDLGYKHSLDRLNFYYRFRFQQHNPFGNGPDNDLTTKYRLRIKTKYNFRKWKLDPTFAFEGFFASVRNEFNFVESITETERVSGFEKIRFTLATTYKINDLMELRGFYRVEHLFGSYPLQYNTPATIFIGGLNLTFKL